MMCMTRRAIPFEKENSNIIDTIYEVIASLNSKLNEKNINIYLKNNGKTLFDM